MEGEVQSSSNNMGKFILPTVIVALIVFAAIGFYVYNSNQPQSKPQNEAISSQSPSATDSEPEQRRSRYRNGQYSMTGNYVSPGGPREVNVTLTLENGVVSDASAEGTATDATSKRFQGEFVSGFAPMVIGKSLDEVNLTKVAGSSLTPKGFMDAVEKIKTQASS